MSAQICGKVLRSILMSRRLRYWILFADLVWILVALAGAFAIRYSSLNLATLQPLNYHDYFVVALVALAIWSVLYAGMRLDGFSGGWSLPGILSQVLIGVLLLMAILLSSAFLARQYYSRLILLYFGCFLIVGFVGIRCLMRLYIVSRSRRGALRRVVILGNGRVAREVANKIAMHPELMKKVVGFVYPSFDLPTGSPNADLPNNTTASINTVGVAELLREQRIDEIIVAHPRASVSQLQKLITATRTVGIGVSLVPQWYDLYISRARFLDVGGLPLLSLEEQSPSSLLLPVKRLADVVAASFFLVLALPVFAFSALVLLHAGERPFRRDRRCGLLGKEFSMWRINVDRDAEDLRGVRKWLASLSLTELPQLWNVICGDMTLVGPRPEPPERVKHYSEWQRQRLKVKPGLTGLAQVHGLREKHSSEEKTRFDLQYILRWSPFLDLALLLQTVWTVGIRLWNPPSHKLASSVFKRRNVPVLEVVNADRTHAGAD